MKSLSFIEETITNIHHPIKKHYYLFWFYVLLTLSIILIWHIMRLIQQLFSHSFLNCLLFIIISNLFFNFIKLPFGGICKWVHIIIFPIWLINYLLCSSSINNFWIKYFIFRGVVSYIMGSFFCGFSFCFFIYFFLTYVLWLVGAS